MFVYALMVGIASPTTLVPGVLNGTWGDLIDLPASLSASPVKWNKEYSLLESYRAENCSVAA